MNDVELYGVSVNDDLGLPQEGLRRIGFVARFEGPALADDVLDASILYEGAGVSVTLEVPDGTDVPDVDALVRMAALVGVGICLFPPATDDDAAWDAYGASLVEYVGAYRSKGNFERELVPVTGVLRSMYREAFSGIAEEPSLEFDGHLVGDFSRRAAARTAEMVASAFDEAFGGRAGFVEHASSCAAEIRRFAERVVQEALAKASA